MLVNMHGKLPLKSSAFKISGPIGIIEILCVYCIYIYIYITRLQFLVGITDAVHAILVVGHLYSNHKLDLRTITSCYIFIKFQLWYIVSPIIYHTQTIPNHSQHCTIIRIRIPVVFQWYSSGIPVKKHSRAICIYFRVLSFLSK